MAGALYRGAPGPGCCAGIPPNHRGQNDRHTRLKPLPFRNLVSRTVKNEILLILGKITLKGNN